MKYRLVPATIAVLVALPAAAQIYRCQVDGITAFSDRPCGPDSAPYTSADEISFIIPDENLPALAEAAQSFIRERRERLARRARSARQAATPEPGPPASRETVYVPWPVIGHAGHEKRFREEAGPRPDIAGNARYSPLNGPILGTPRDSWLFERKHSRSYAERRK